MGIPSNCYWGVDSFNPLHKPIGGKPSLLECIKEKTGATPSFWGRYLVGAKESMLTKEEVEWLKKNSPRTRLLLVYDKPNNVGGNASKGRDDALAAISAANDLGVSDGVTIYADLEPHDGKVSADWILGWWGAMKASRFGGRGGLYANTASTFWAAYLEPAYKAAIEKMPAAGSDPALWGMYPLKGCRPPDKIDFPYFPGSLPSQLGDPIVWQYAINCFIPAGNTNGLCDMDLATQTGFESMWSIAPPSFFPPTDEEFKNMFPKDW